jgi:hypothetical protein
MSVVIRLTSGREISTKASPTTWANIRKEIEEFPTIELIKDGRLVVILTRHIESIEVEDKK